MSPPHYWKFMFSTSDINFRSIEANLTEIWHKMQQNCPKRPFLTYFFNARRPSWNFSKFWKDVHRLAMVLYDVSTFQKDPMSHLWDLMPEGRTDGRTDGCTDGRKVFLYPPLGPTGPTGIKIWKKHVGVSQMHSCDQNCRCLALVVLAVGQCTHRWTDRRRVIQYPPSSSASPWGIKIEFNVDREGAQICIQDYFWGPKFARRDVHGKHRPPGTDK